MVVPPGLLAALRDGVATVTAGGALVACNGPMRELLTALGRGTTAAANLTELGHEAADSAALSAGASISVAADRRHWRLHLVVDGDMRWLVSTEVAADERAAAVVETARLRALARASAALVHDFNNHLNACLGLAAQIRPLVTDALELQILRELTTGTQQGAALARAIARSLGRATAERAIVPATQLLDEALAVVNKAAAQREVRLVRQITGATPVVRTVVVEAVQVLWQTLMALVERSPRRLVVTLARGDFALAGGRVRPVARVRLVAEELTREVVAEVLSLVECAPGFTITSARSPIGSDLVTAVFVQRRLGGDLIAAAVDDGLQLDLSWPALP